MGILPVPRIEYEDARGEGLFCVAYINESGDFVDLQQGLSFFQVSQYHNRVRRDTPLVRVEGLVKRVQFETDMDMVMGPNKPV